MRRLLSRFSQITAKDFQELRSLAIAEGFRRAASPRSCWKISKETPGGFPKCPMRMLCETKSPNPSSFLTRTDSKRIFATVQSNYTRISSETRTQPVKSRLNYTRQERRHKGASLCYCMRVWTGLDPIHVETTADLATSFHRTSAL